VPSDPFLFYGFEHKGLHIRTAEPAMKMDIEIDFLGNGHWDRYATVGTRQDGYCHHAFPNGFSAHWVRLTAAATTTASAHFYFT
jgi:hypothetical protein